MKRRTFLKTAATFSAVSVLTPSFTLANEEKNPFGITKKPRLNFGYHFQKMKIIKKLYHLNMMEILVRQKL